MIALERKLGQLNRNTIAVQRQQEIHDESKLDYESLQEELDIYLNSWSRTPPKIIRHKSKLKRAANGDVKEQFKMAVMFHLGQKVDRDPKEALFWYAEVLNAEDEHASLRLKSMNNIGVMYLNGDGVEIDEMKSFGWWAFAEMENARLCKHKSLREMISFNLATLAITSKDERLHSAEIACRRYAQASDKDLISSNNYACLQMIGDGCDQAIDLAVQEFHLNQEYEIGSLTAALRHNVAVMRRLAVIGQTSEEWRIDSTDFEYRLLDKNDISQKIDSKYDYSFVFIDVARVAKS